MTTTKSRRELIQHASVALAKARRDVERIAAVVDALNACGDAYAHFIDSFDSDLDAAEEHLSKCVADMIAATTETERGVR